jgi:asparagine synthase (glutamine-hydrolysing)
MCGIVGIVDAPSEQRSRLLRRMSDAIVHRGPDEEGFHEDARVALGVRRLAIQDVRHGHQPVHDESSNVICVLNGEIYNVHELQAMLRARGHTLASESDTECIPHLYEEFGLSFVDHLRGMFAIALWDKAQDRLVLVRDRLGKKPLYYWDAGRRLTFGSELKALLVDAALPREADPVAISHYLTYQYVPAPWSAVARVKKLPPGHMLVKTSGSTTVTAYWRLEYAAAGQPCDRTDDELVEELRERLLDSVRVRMVGERPLGAFLSGGLDSSAVVGAMSQIGTQDIKTFSIGFDEESHNELPHAARVAQRYETEHHERVVRPDALKVIPQLAASFDEPYADSSAIPSWYLAEMASQHVVVALNGDGGDEALGGYTRYLRYLAGGTRRIPRPLAAGMLRVGSALRGSGGRHPLIRKAGTAALLLGESDPAHRYARFLSYFRPEEKFAIFTDEFASQVRAHGSYGLVDDLWSRHRGTDPINRLLAVDTHSYLPGDLLPKVDITTMSVSLEARSPFLDHQFMEWAAAIPGDRKIHDGSGKHLLKRALTGWVDDDLIHRRKQGFGIPLGDWLRGPLRSMTYDVLTDSTANSRGIFEPAGVRALLDDHMSGTDRSAHVYALLMLELWYREVLLPVPVGA